MNKRKGVSLVALVITIVVLIILTSTVIILINQDGIIDKSKEAVFKSDVQNFREELSLTILNKQANFEIMSKSDIGEKRTLAEIQEYIKSFTSKYDGKLLIKNGELYGDIVDLTDEEINFTKELGVKTVIDVPLEDKTSADVEGIWSKQGNSFLYKYIGSEEEVIIPAKIDGNPTKLMYSYTFMNNNTVKKLYVPGTIAYYNGEIFNFASMNALEEIYFGDGITEIRQGAVRGCTNLKRVYLPDTLESIGEGFCYCNQSLEEIYIPDSVTKIGSNSFYSCTNLKKVKLSDNLKVINDWMFTWCDKIEEIDLPSQLEEIGLAAFARCTGITKIVIPSKVNKIGRNAFLGCSNLTTIVIPQSTQIIETASFPQCYKLNDITILQKKSESPLVSQLSQAGFTSQQINNIKWLSE